MNDLTSFSVIRYRPPILWPNLPDLQSTCTRLTEMLSAAAASLVDRYLSIHALGWADNFYRQMRDMQIIAVTVHILAVCFAEIFPFCARFVNCGYCALSVKTVYFKSAVLSYWIVCNHFVAPYLIYSNYTHKRIFVKRQNNGTS